MAEKIKGSVALIRSLIEEDIKIVWGYPGGQIMPIYDALYDYLDQIHHILTRHEQGAIHAAQGQARVTGKTGVVFATSGPGATNLITGIADAQIDSTPLVCITGQVGTPLLGTDAFQETDVIGISMPVTKWNYQITDAAEIPEIMAKAFYIARTGRPGPVLIDITKDAQNGLMEFSYKKCNYVRSYVPEPDIDVKRIEEAAALINSAKKPYVLFGQGVLLGHAEEEMRAFVEKGNIPAAWTILGLSALPTAHALNMGMLGMHGNYGPNLQINQCDVLIAIGMRFDDRVTGNLQTFAKQAKIIHLDIDNAEIDKNVKVDIAVIGNVKQTLPLLTASISKGDHAGWIGQFREHYKKEYETVVKRTCEPGEGPMKMGEVCARVSEATNGDAIVTTDVGQNQMFATRYFRFNQTRSIVTSGGLGTMGFGLPSAMGAKMGKPDRTVVCVVGDGGLQMTIQEMGTIKQTEIDVKILLLNNNYLGMVRQWQELFFDKRYASTYLVNPDFIKIAEGYGIPGRKITQRKDLDEGIKEMLAHKGAYLLEVEIEMEANVFPMVPAGASVSDMILTE